jgi:hypothetical protein
MLDARLEALLDPLESECLATAMMLFRAVSFWID